MKKNLVITGASLAVRVSGAFIQLVMSWLIVQLYGPEAVGRFLLGLMGATGFAILIKQGVDVALVQYFPGNSLDDTNKKTIVRFFLKELLLRSVVMTILIIAAWALIAGTADIWLMLLSAAGIAINILLSEYLKAEGNVILAGLLQFFLAPAIATAIYGIIFLAHDQPWHMEEVPYSAELIWVVVWTTLLIVEFGIFFAGGEKAKTKIDVQVHISHLKEMGKKIMNVNLIGFAIGWADIALSALVYEKMVSSVYGVANKLAMTGTFLAVAITSVFGRKLSYYYEKQDMEGFRKIYRESQLVAVVLGVPVILVFLLYSEVILGLWGSEFMAGKWILVWMIISQNLLILFGPSNYALLMLNKADILSRIYACGLVTMIAVCYVLEASDVAGVYSVVIATLTGNMMINLASYFYIKTKVF